MNEEKYVSGLAHSLYMEGYDADPELLGSKIKDLGKKIVSKVKKIKRKGGVSVSTPGGSLQVGKPAAPVLMPEETLMDKAKTPAGMAVIAGAAIVLFMVMKKKKGGRK